MKSNVSKERRWTNEVDLYAQPHIRLRAIASVLSQYGCQSVTDIGCATGTLRHLLPNGTPYHGIDFVERLDTTSDTVSFTRVDLNKESLPSIPIKSEWIVCSGVLEYVEDVPRVLDWLREGANGDNPRIVLSYFNDSHIRRKCLRVLGRDPGGHEDWAPLVKRNTFLSWLSRAGIDVELVLDMGRSLGGSPSVRESVEQSVRLYQSDCRSSLLAHQWIVVGALQ